jgi:hypothetical protein
MLWYEFHDVTEDKFTRSSAIKFFLWLKGKTLWQNQLQVLIENKD